MDSVFVVDPKSRKDIVGLEGEVTKAFNLSGACVFRDRCQYAKVLCHRQSPQLVEASPGEFVACHFLLR
jgi:peptide/nickel transport system ATP-binding protein